MELNVVLLYLENFTKNEVLKWFDYEIHKKMCNADRIDQYGFFIGNHQILMKEEIKQVRLIFDKYTQ